MNISICITVFNEEKSISNLIESLIRQTKKPDEIVIVDGGSSDKTIEIIKHHQKKERSIKLLAKKCSRSEGRNLAVELAKNEIIAMTDAGCIAKSDWMEKLTKPFNNKEIDVVAGFYDMLAENDMQKAMSYYLGVLPNHFDATFLPSTRSTAFRKSVWENLGGFPETLDDTAEDTTFNYKILKNGFNISRVKNARVEWRMPETLKEFSKKLYLYAKGDAKSGIWKHPSKGFLSHNMKAIYKILRYLFGLTIFILALFNPIYWIILITIIFLYSLWALRKVYIEFKNVEVGFWGVIMQYISDTSVILGFTAGQLK